MNDQAVEKVSEKLVSAFHVLGVIFTPEDSSDLASGYLKIDQRADMHNIVISQL